MSAGMFSDVAVLMMILYTRKGPSVSVNDGPGHLPISIV